MTQLTRDDLVRAMAKIRADSEREWEERGKRIDQARAWRDSLPEHVRDSYLVVGMVELSVAGVPIHPRDAERLRDELARLIG